MTNFRWSILVAAGIGFIPFAYNACSATRFEGITQSTKESGSTAGNPMTMMKVAPYAPDRVHYACVDAIVFREIVDGPEQLVRFVPRVIKFIPSGTDLGELGLPRGSFVQVDMLLSPSCGNEMPVANQSVVISNSRGTFSSEAAIEVKFYGNFVSPDPGGRKLVLDINALASNWERVTNGTDIAPLSEQTEGSFFSDM
jgi:hypothetical protein